MYFFDISTGLYRILYVQNDIKYSIKLDSDLNICKDGVNLHTLGFYFNVLSIPIKYKDVSSNFNITDNESLSLMFLTLLQDNNFLSIIENKCKNHLDFIIKNEKMLSCYRQFESSNLKSSLISVLNILSERKSKFKQLNLFE